MANLTMTVRKKTHLLRSVTVLGILGMLLLAGCNTTSGFGQDMQSAGRGIERGAEKAK